MITAFQAIDSPVVEDIVQYSKNIYDSGLVVGAQVLLPRSVSLATALDSMSKLLIFENKRIPPR